MTQLQLEFSQPSEGDRFTPEQRFAIDHREGDLLLDAGAGSGKTTVLVERFVRSVVDDRIEVGRILAITFTEKAAAELRERIRRRLAEAGREQDALATESAWISTIHGFCARVVRAHALRVGIDPEFAVLDAADATRIAAEAFDAALAQLAGEDAGADLIAAYGPGRLRSAILAAHGELRSRGLERPALPGGQRAAGSGATELERVRRSALAALRELGAVSDPGKRVGEALAMLESVDTALDAGVPWPGALDALKLSDGAGHLRTDACEEYRESLRDLRAVAEAVHAGAIRDALDALLREFGSRYAALKRARSVLDFEDLELFGRRLLRDPTIGARYRERFERVMVDEMQDTNRVQLELIDAVAGGRLFMVGDAQQSIYAFRHADVELFEARGRALAQRGARASLQTNFRSLPAVLDVINAAFAAELGQSFRSLQAGRSTVTPVAGRDRAGADGPGRAEPAVELLIVDRDGDYDDEGSVAPWRLAEARALAARVRALLDEQRVTPGDVVVLTRATTDLAAYERALVEAGVPTYVIGGRGYWEHPQVIALTSYLRALANPLDEEAWYTTLLSPVCGLSLDGLVLVADGATDELGEHDRARLSDFEAWFAGERAAAAWVGAEELIDRALARHGYELWIAGLPDGRRRLANVRKLMRLGRQWEAAHGSDLRGFVDLLSERATGDEREGEAPVESEALDAVRLMSIHRSKGLEFPVVCVADLGRQSTSRGSPIIRIGRDGERLGLRIGRPGTAGLIEALDYAELKAEQAAAEAAEERRLFYVAMTRAEDRLILSGAAHLFDWETKNRSAPIGWIGSALVPDLGARLAEGRFTSDRGVEVSALAGESEVAGQVAGCGPERESEAAGRAGPRDLEAAGQAASRDSEHVVWLYDPQPAQSCVPEAPDGLVGAFASEGQVASPAPLPSTLSYTALSAYERCAYRFYVEHVLRLPAIDPPAEPAGSPAAPAGGSAAPGLAGTALGIAVHELLREFDFARRESPASASATVGAPGLPDRLAAFARSATADRLAAALELRREQPFAFLLGEDLLITGVFDVLARERADRTREADPSGRLLVVDYKSDRLGPGVSPEQLTAERYATQQLVYALAALHSGAAEVEVVHLFLERPELPVTRTHLQHDRPTLEAELSAKVAGLRAGDYPVTDAPGLQTCAGCPAAGGLCSHPLAVTSRPR